MVEFERSSTPNLRVSIISMVEFVLRIETSVEYPLDKIKGTEISKIIWKIT